MRRRKPVVVVAVAAAGLLAAGGIVATRAGAAEKPQWPDVSGFSLSDLPGFSGFSGFSDDDAGSDDDVFSNDGAGSDDAQPAGDRGDGLGTFSGADGDVRDAGPGAHRSMADVSGTADAASVHRAPAVRGPAAGSGAGDGDGSAARVRPDRVPAGAAHAVPEKPAAPQRPAMVRQVAGGSLIAASKENVTAADISESPNAPVQQQILVLINGNRRAHGCRAVTLDRRLIGAANGHAADMARHDYFAHESRDGHGAGDRVTDAGYNWKHYGENIARGVDSPYAVVDGWMHSPEHRHNILDCTLDQMGVGLAIAGDRARTVYWVQDFATPM
jgi:uncharacterized protein YkwD